MHPHSLPSTHALPPPTAAFRTLRPLLQILQYHVVPQQALTASELYDGLVLNTLLPPNVSTPSMAATGLMPHMMLQKPTVVKHQLTILNVKVRRGAGRPGIRGCAGSICVQDSEGNPARALSHTPPAPHPTPHHLPFAGD